MYFLPLFLCTGRKMLDFSHGGTWGLSPLFFISKIDFVRRKVLPKVKGAFCLKCSDRRQWGPPLGLFTKFFQSIIPMRTTYTPTTVSVSPAAKAFM